MNETLFFFVVAVGVSSGMLFRRQAMTRAEAASLVFGRIALGAVLAFYVPKELNLVFYMALGAHEVAHGIQFLIALTVDKSIAKWEAQKWLHRSQTRGTSFVTKLKGRVRGLWPLRSS